MGRGLNQRAQQPLYWAEGDSDSPTNAINDDTNTLKRSLDMAGPARSSIISRGLAIIKEAPVSTVSLAVLLFRSAGCLETF
jgi:hypothetical protein